MRRQRLHYGPFLIPTFLVGVLVAVAMTAAPLHPRASRGCGTGTGVSGANGVLINASGVLELQHFSDPDGAIMRRRIAESRASLDPQIAKLSKLRKVSLNRLEAAVKKSMAEGKLPTEEMQTLAGMTRVSYVFYYPETKDIVIAGPAEAWTTDLTGRQVGIQSGRPTLELQDLIVALRAFAPGKKATSAILVSIDPTQEGLARIQQFLNTVGSNIDPHANVDAIVHGLRTSGGMQNVRVNGIAPNTHMAQVLLECDYRMKLIGIGVEEPPVKMATYVEKASPGGRNALERWYFVPDYGCAHMSDDQLALQLTGDVVRLVAENQLVATDGNRAATGKTNKASELFTQGFTAKYSDLSARLPVYSEMRNCIDLTIAAAFIQKQDFYTKAGWKAELFNDEQTISVQTYNTPLQVETVCTAVWKGNTLMTPVGGGVTIHPREAIAEKNLQIDKDNKIHQTRESIDLSKLPANRWWWD